MADKLNNNNNSNNNNMVRPLKIGKSFTQSRSIAFHTVKYDFKPASVDTNKIASVDVGGHNEVTVTVPHLDGAGVQQTVFKGSQRPYQKECVLIIDRNTGEITLEKLSANVQVKRTRCTNHTAAAADGAAASKPRRCTTPPPSVVVVHASQRVSSKTKVTSGVRHPDRPITQLVVPKHHSPLHPSPKREGAVVLMTSSSYDQQGASHPHHSPLLASLPMIDDSSPPPPPPPTTIVNGHHHHSAALMDEVGVMSDSSSSSSASSSSSSSSASSSSATSMSSSSAGDKRRHHHHHHHHHHHRSSNSSRHHHHHHHNNNRSLNRTVIDRYATSGAITPLNGTNSNSSRSATPSNGYPAELKSSTTTSATSASAAANNHHILNEDLCLSESGSDSD